MDQPKLILDFGCSQLRGMLAGDVKPHFVTNNFYPPKIDELREFLEQNNNMLKNNSGVILVEKNKTDLSLREELCELLFDKFSISRLFIMKSGAGLTYASGRSSGNIAEFSETALEIGSIEDGYIDQSALVTSNFSLRERWGDDTKRCRDILVQSINEERSKLPDGIKIDQQEFTSIIEGLLKEYKPNRQNMKKEIVFSGRPFLHCGFYDAFAKKVSEKFNIHSLSNNVQVLENGALIGASILGVMNEIDPLFITREDWKEGQMKLINKQFQ